MALPLVLRDEDTGTPVMGETASENSCGRLVIAICGDFWR